MEVITVDTAAVRYADAWKRKEKPIELKSHQEKAVSEMHNGCILWGGVGTGKTITSLAYYYTKVCKGVIGDRSSMREPKDLIVITTAKKRDSLDWQNDAMKLGVFVDKENNPDGISITVDSWNNIGKYVGTEGAFFVFDEQRAVGGGEWVKAFIKICRANEWIMLSATPGDTWLDYIPVFVANGFYRNRTEFKREHVVYNNYAKFPKVDRYVNVNKLIRFKNAVLVEMPYERHTVRHTTQVLVDYNEAIFERVVKDRWHVFEKRPLRDVAELFSVMRKVANSDTSRLTAVQDLLTRHPKLIVFYNFDYELEALRTLASMPMGFDTQSSTPTNSDGRTSSSNVIPLFPKSSDNQAFLETEVLSSTTTTQSSSSNVPKANREEPSRRTSSKTSSESDFSMPNGSTSSLGTESSTKSESGISTRSPHSQEIPTCHQDLSSQYQEASFKSHHLEESKSVTSEDSSHPAQTRLDVETNDAGLSHPMDSGTADAWRRTEDSSFDQQTNRSAGPASTFALAEWNGHKHEPIPKTDRWVYLVQYQAGSEGWNCIETDAMCFYSLTYSYKMFHQAHGRIDRLNTPFTDLYYYILVSRSLIDRLIGRSLKAKKSFNEREAMKAVKAESGAAGYEREAA